MDIIVGGIYKHYKGRIYKVIAIGKHTETQEPVVIYKAIDPDNSCENGTAETIWVRPASMWNETVRTDKGDVLRFTLT